MGETRFGFTITRDVTSAAVCVRSVLWSCGLLLHSSQQRCVVESLANKRTAALLGRRLLRIRSWTNQPRGRPTPSVNCGCCARRRRQRRVWDSCYCCVEMFCKEQTAPALVNDGGAGQLGCGRHAGWAFPRFAAAASVHSVRVGVYEHWLGRSNHWWLASALPPCYHDPVLFPLAPRASCVSCVSSAARREPGTSPT